MASHENEIYIVTTRGSYKPENFFFLALEISNWTFCSSGIGPLFLLMWLNQELFFESKICMQEATIKEKMENKSC